MWRNRLKLGYRIERKGWVFQIVWPAHRKKVITVCNWVISIVGLVSAFFVFGSVWYAFAFGLGLFVLGKVVEKTVFLHYAGFVHALPREEMDPSKWVGISFGTALDPSTGEPIHSLAMVVTEPVFAERMNSLVREWTMGACDDRDENVGISIVELDESNYVFLCYPKMSRKVAHVSFKEAKAELRKSSLTDRLAELHAIAVFGKKCHLSPNSPYPGFVASYRAGQAVVLEFGVPYMGNVLILDAVPAIKVHAFRIVKEADLTRRDFEKEAMQSFLSGGEWQGPPELAPPDWK